MLRRIDTAGNSIYPGDRIVTFIDFEICIFLKIPIHIHIPLVKVSIKKKTYITVTGGEADCSPLPSRPNISKDFFGPLQVEKFYGNIDISVNSMTPDQVDLSLKSQDFAPPV